ncbi:MAG: hypothetical protein OEW19_13100 [Acidobacteriota bacterium]|nr:hypothetical protein [Acidobacteriota bacterium]
MSEFLLNGQPIPVESGQKTWGELLRAVDAHVGAHDEVVTAVRFAHVDQPSFREADLHTRPVPELGRIEVDTMPRARLLRTTLGTAGLSLPEVAAAACRAATAFRHDDDTEGRRQLSALLATVHTLVELTLASAAVAGADLSELPCGAESASAIFGATGVVLDGLAQHQQSKDWSALADELEFGLAPALLRWGVIFEAMQERCAV